MFRAILPAVVTVGLLAAPRAAADVRPASSLDAVLAKASAYVVAYGDAFSTVVAEERYTQTYDDPRGARQEVRTLRSEFVLVRVADRDEWIAFRDVFEVDGARVHGREDRLQRLFLDAPDGALERARAIADESARHNLGPVIRTFNVPTAALFFLHPANRGRFRFRLLAERRRGDEVLWEVSYEETRRPTIIRAPDGRSIPARGTFSIDPDTGRVAGSELRAREPGRGLDARVIVTFSYHPDLDAWTPSEMREHYETRDGQRVTGRATYHNFRRFRVDVRIR